MTRRTLAVLSVLTAVSAGCGRAPAAPAPEVSDPPRLARASRVDLPERVPAYGIAVGRGDALRLEVSIEAADSAQVHPGQTAEVSVLPSTVAVACRVERVLLAASTETGQSLAWLKPLTPATRLAPNDFVYARITTGVRRGVLTVPIAAVLIRGGRTIVVRAEDGGKKYAAIDVKIGASDGEPIEIVSGLSTGDEVVVEGGLGAAFPDFKAGDN